MKNFKTIPMMNQQTQEKRLLVTLYDEDLQKMIAKAVEDGLRSKPELNVQKNIDEYFPGLIALATYLRCSVPKAGQILKQLPSDGFVRVGKTTRIYKWAVDQYLQGKFKP